MTTQPAPLPPHLTPNTATNANTATAIAPPPPRPRLTRLPDPPHPPDMVTQIPNITRAHSILGDRYEGRPDVLIIGDGYLCYDASDRRRAPRPDCLVAFGLTQVTPQQVFESRGYTISEVGKPPDFVLEVASPTTGGRDINAKRRIYAGLKVFEYWRFDRTGGRFHNAALAGDRLMEDGAYAPIPIHEQQDGIIRGHSAALELELRWVKGLLWFWDPATREYLPDLTTSKAQTAAAEARIRQLEAQLAALRQSPNP